MKLFPALPLLAIVALAGCHEAEGITRYRIPKRSELAAPPQPAPAAPKDRMLAAIVPHNDRAWFFKVTGPMASVAKEHDQFVDFVKGVRFEGDGKEPNWTLPKGWTEQPGDALRHATLTIPAEEGPLELSVTGLDKLPGHDDEYALSNINRWRGQMGLPPTTNSAVKKEAVRFEVAGEMATMVNLEGNQASGGPGRGAFAMPGIERPSAIEAPPRGADQAAGLTYDIPDGWEQAPAGGMRKAAFQVAGDSENAEITVIDLDASAGDLLDNVNRWRGQVKLDPLTKAELKKSLVRIEMGEVQGDYIALVGPADAVPRETILGVIAKAAGRVWFIKLKGDADLAEREKLRFEQFVQSVRFTNSEDVGDGN